MEVEALPDQEHDRRAVRIDPLGAVVADELRGEVGDAGVEQLEAAAGVLVGDLRDHRLQRQLAVELIDAPHQPGHFAVAVGAGILRAHRGRLLHRFDAPGKLHRLPHALVGRLRVGQGKPVCANVECHVGDKRRHDDHRRALAHPRLEAALGEILLPRIGADERVAEGGEVVLRRGGLDAGVEAPAEGVGAVGEADGGLVQADRRHVCLQGAVVAGHRLPVGFAMGHRHRQGQLHLAALGKHLFHVLLVGDRVEGEDPDRPAAADVVVEAVAGLRGGIWAVVRAGEATVPGEALGGRDVSHVLDEPFVEERRFDEDRPRQDCRRRPADPAGADVVLACSPADTAQAGLGGRLGERCRVVQAERFEERPAPQLDLPHPMAANQLREVPARHLLPHRRLARLGEEVVGGLELLPEEAADVVVFDAGAVGGIGPEGLECRPQHHRHLDLADDVDELFGRERHPRPAHLRSRHRHRDGVGAHRFAHLRHELPPLVVTNGIEGGFPSGDDPAVGEDPGLEGVDILRQRRHAQRSADLAVVNGERQPRGEEID